MNDSSLALRFLRCLLYDSKCRFVYNQAESSNWRENPGRGFDGDAAA